MLWFNLPRVIYWQIYISTFIFFQIMPQIFYLSSLLFEQSITLLLTPLFSQTCGIYVYCSWLRISVCRLWLLVEFLSTFIPVKPAVFLNNPHIHGKIRTSVGSLNIFLHTSEPPGIPQLSVKREGTPWPEKHLCSDTARLCVDISARVTT